MPRKSKRPRQGSAGSGARRLKVKVTTAKGRKLSSTRWLDRQLNDPYVVAAKRDGYRSRAAFKLMEIDDKFHLIQPGCLIVDLGAAPGGWTQIAAQRSAAQSNDNKIKRKVIAVDLAEMEPIPGVEIIRCNFLDAGSPERIRSSLGGQSADLVLSDMAPSAVGHRQTDHLRIVALCEAAYEFAQEVLAPGGVFLAKVLQGGTENALLTSMKRHFKAVRHVKPKASRTDSSELYVLATGFRPRSSTE